MKGKDLDAGDALGTYIPLGLKRDFEVCFLVPLDSSDIATPARTCSLKKKLISCRIFYFSGLGTSSFCSEQILAQ
jgi:hypothetical protein